MSNFEDALREKIEELENDKAKKEEEFENDKARIDVKIELLVELLDGEASVPKKKAGRPRGSKGKKKASKASIHGIKDDIYEEAMRTLENSEEGSTSPELQKKLTKRYNPQPRVVPQAKNIHAGTKKEMDARLQDTKNSADTVISIEDDLPEEE